MRLIILIVHVIIVR